MPGFSDLNLNVTNLTPKAIDQLIEDAIRCNFYFHFLLISFDDIKNHM